MASGNLLCGWTARCGFGPATNYATIDTRNNVPVLEFDTTTSETIYFFGVMPANYAGGGVNVKVAWMGDTATSGTVQWDVAFERGTTDLDADSFAAVQTATGSANGTSGIETVTTVAFTNGAQMDSVVAGDTFRLSVLRNTGVGSNMAGDAQVKTVTIYEV